MKTLGLDLGPNSIGWAVVEDNSDGSGRLIDAGVRVFPEGVDAFDTGKESSRNEQRRTARMMRRQIRRRARRRKVVEAALVEARLLPDNEAGRKAILATDPYPLRARGVTEKLDPFEIGRVFYHLNQRRGFLSLKKVSKEKVEKELKAIEKRKAKAAESGKPEEAGKKEDDSKMLAQIALLAQTIGDRTLGKTLHAQQTEGAARTTHGTIIPHRIRSQHTSRRMIEEEFLRIWDFQSVHHPQLLSDRSCFGARGRLGARATRDAEPIRFPIGKHVGPTAKAERLIEIARGLLARDGIHGLIFFQRPVYWLSSTIGKCEYEPKEQRCPRADRRAQRYRLLCDLNNMRYDRPGDYGEKALDAEQRADVMRLLESQKEVQFSRIRKILGPFEDIQINLEQMVSRRGKKAKKGVDASTTPKREKMKGHETDAEMRSVYPKWDAFDDAVKTQIVTVLVGTRTRNEKGQRSIEERLCAIPGVDSAIAEKLASADLPDKYLSVSLKFIEKVLPYLEAGTRLSAKDKGEIGAMERAGYESGFKGLKEPLAVLPAPNSRMAISLKYITNPVVKAAMWQIWTVVNTILREHFKDGSKPDRIHVEMIRSMKKTTEMRRIDAGEKKTLDKQNEAIRSEIRALGAVPTNDAVKKYKLWLEQGMRCAYTGDPIARHQLFHEDGLVQVDHILPQSRTADDAMSNLVVCFTTANQEKRNRLPSDWLGAEALKDLESRCKHLPWPKRQKLKKKEIDDDFVETQLTDTSYIAKATVGYLHTIVGRHGKVVGLKGQYTSELAHQWGLNTILFQMPGSPAFRTQTSPADHKKMPKNRDDHRHHAIDAIVIALSRQDRLNALLQDKYAVIHRNKEGKLVETYKFESAVDAPWGMEPDAFRALVFEKLKAMNVSHRVRRGVSGGLHEETNYGAVYERTKGDRREKRRDGEFVVRKSVEALSMSEVGNIRDETIKNIVIRRLGEHKIAFGRGADKVPPKKMQEAMKDLKMPSGVPIRKVRIRVMDSTIQSIREKTGEVAYVSLGANHHVCVFEWTERGKVKRGGVYVRRLDAAKRILNRDPIVQRTHPDRPDARFVMSLCTGDTILITDAQGKETAHIVTTLVYGKTQKRIHAASAYDARKDRVSPSITGQLLSIRKVTVDPLGRIRWAND